MRMREFSTIYRESMEEQEGFTNGKGAELQALLRELIEAQDADKMASLADSTLQLLQALPSSIPVSSLTNQLHGSGVILWNKAVSLKSAAAISLSLNAQLRHVAVTLVFLCTPHDNSEQLLKKQITMAIKTGRAWLECDNPVMAETSLELANQCWERLCKNYPLSSNTSESTKLLFKILCSQAEALLGTEQEDKGIEYVKKARGLLSTQDREMGYLSMLCYNFGLQQFQCGKYGGAVNWLKESYDIGRGCSTVGAVKQARTLRLLANSYLEWDGHTHWQKALNAVGLANSEHSHPAGLLLKFTILLEFNTQTDRTKTALQDMLAHPDLTMEIGVSAMRLASQHNQQELALSALQILKQKLKSPSDQQSLQRLHLELLLEGGHLDQAKELIEDCIENHASSEPLDTKTVQHYHLILWEQASKSFEKGDYICALDWYKYSLLLFPSDATSNKNIAKLQRNCCICYIYIEDLSKAMEAIQMAIEHDKNSAHSYYLAFKVSVLLKKEEEALAFLQAMMECTDESDDLPGLLAMAAQIAFENNDRQLAVQALESVAKTSCNTQQVLTALRCLMRLKMTLLRDDSNDKVSLLQSMLQYTELAKQRLSEDCASFDQALYQSELTWFMKITWNIALQAGDAYSEMRKAFDTCQKFSLMLPTDKTTTNRCKTCHLMAAAAALQAGRRLNRQEEKISHLQAVLSHVQKCRELCQDLDLSASDPTLSLLVLYEFEAQLILGLPDAMQVISVINSSCPQVEPKTYETIAALAVRIPPKEGGTQLVQNALKMAITIHKQANSVDLERLSHCTHSLVQILLGGEYSHDMAGKEQAFAVLSESLQIMKSKGKYPEMEVVWHMAKTWNTGIYLYSVLRYKEAEQWCSLAMKFLPQLPESLCQNYKDQMSSVYTEILDKLEGPQPSHLQ